MGNSRRLQSARFGAMVLVGALALGLNPPSAVPPASAAASAPDPAASTVRIATLNTAATSSTRAAFNDVKNLLAQGPDIVALQEMSSGERRQRVRERLTDCGTCVWDGWFPRHVLPGGLPILWRSDKFTFVGNDWFEVAPATYVGDRGAGPSTIRARYVTRLRLRDNATNRIIWVLNTHFVPTVEGPNGRRNGNVRRTRLYSQHMTGLLGLIDRIRTKEGGGLVFVAGDFNVNYRKDKVAQDPIFPYSALATRDLRSSYFKLGEPALGTHILDNGFDKRVIDYVHYRPSRRAVAVGQTVLRGFNSDHRPMIADFRIRSRGCWAGPGRPVC